MPMEKKFFVIDGEGNVSWSAKNDAPEFFKKKSTAYQRARELASANPGTFVHIVETSEIVIAKVGTPERIGVHK